MSDELRLAIEGAIESLIVLLDMADGDPDAEPDAPESDGDDEDYDVVIAA